MQPELSTVREQLLSEFLPDDVCPLGSQSFTDSPCKVYQLESRASESHDDVIRVANFIYFLSI